MTRTLGWFIDSVPGVGKVLGHGGEVDGQTRRWVVLQRSRDHWFTAPRPSPSGERLSFTALDLRATVWLGEL